jgi:hypothetical protein
MNLMGDKDLLNSQHPDPAADQTAQPATTSEPTSPVQAPTPENISDIPKNKSSKKLFKILVALILLILLAVVAVLAYQNYQLKNQIQTPTTTPQPTQSPPSPTPDPTADWETYTNDKYGFVFKYPNRWSEIKPTNEAYPEGYIVIGGDTKEELLHINVIPFSGDTSDLLAKYQKNNSLFSSINWGELGNMKSQKEINNMDVIWFEKNGTAESSEVEAGLKTNNILFTNGQLGFLINTQVTNNDELDQILSTFKFISDTSDWETYTNTEYNYNIKYPVTFTTQVLAAGAGNKTAPPDARNLFIYNTDTDDPYTNRYINIEAFQIEPTYTEDWTKTQVVLNGQVATKLTDSNQSSDFDIYLVNLVNNQGVLEIYVSNTQDKKQLSNQILSTFEFTK